MNFENQTVLITGGAGGIGLAFAKALAERGNRIIVCGRNADHLATARQNVPDVTAFQCDITNRNQVDDLARLIQDRFGVLHVLINNAGIQRQLDLLDGTEHWDAIQEEINIDLTAQIQVTQRLLPLLTRQTSAIVNVTSALAVVPKRSAPVYCAAKAGLHNFTRTLRDQLRGKPTRVFEVVPALVDTAMTAARPAKGKISPERLVAEALRGIRKNKETIYIERTRLLMAVYRIWPSLAYRVLRGQ